METIKKTILQAVTTGTTTGCTGTCRVIIPDLTKVYYFKICLTQEAHDFGFFDAYVEPVIPEPPTPVETFYWEDIDEIVFMDSDGSIFITGES